MKVFEGKKALNEAILMEYRFYCTNFEKLKSENRIAMIICFVLKSYQLILANW